MKRKTAKHNSCRIGSPVLVALRNGTWTLDRFVGKCGGNRYVVLQNSGKILVEDIKLFVVKPKPGFEKKYGLDGQPIRN